MPNCILSTSADLTLLYSRDQFFKQARFDVRSCRPEAAIVNLETHRNEIIGAVLCHSIELPQRIAIGQRIREIAPDVAIVFMHKPAERFDARAFDVVLRALPKPEALVQSLHQALKKRIVKPRLMDVERWQSGLNRPHSISKVAGV